MADRLELPVLNAFPEGIVVVGDEVVVGGARDGALYRGPIDGSSLDMWSPPHTDGRDHALGMDLDDRGRLWVAGWTESCVWCLDACSGRSLGRRRAHEAMVNDVVAVGEYVYATDCDLGTPRVLRARTAVDGALEPWVDLPALPGQEHFLNGLVAVDGRVLLVVDQEQEVLWRVELSTGEFASVDLGGDTMGGDGLALRDRTLLVVEQAAQLSRWTLSADVRSVRRQAVVASDELCAPTTVAVHEDAALVVNSQLTQSAPERPAWVSVHAL